MPVERTTPQLVKKGKGKKRPGYRGPGGYQGRGGYGASRSSNTSNQGGNRPNPHTSSGTSKTTTVSGNRMRSSARETQQAINNARAIEDARKAKREETLKNTTRFGYQKPKTKLGGLGNLLMSGIGMLMGIPGLGLLTGGFDKLKGGLGSLNETLGDFREKTTGYRTQAEYDAARQQRQLQGRLDNLYDRKAKGKSFSQKNIDMLESQYGLSPSTAQNVLTGRDLKGFTPSRMGLQTFSDPFANTVGTTTKVNAPSNDAVSSYSYGTADAAIPGVETTPSYINEFLNKPITPGKSLPGTSFIDRLYNPEQIVELENKFGNAYQIENSASGLLSDARHMAAMNNLSTSLSPMNNKVGNFIGDTLAFGAGLINEVPALGRGFNKQNLREIVEDIKANYAGSFGTPNQTTSEDIYNQVFGNQKMAQLDSSFADGGIASMFTRRG